MPPAGAPITIGDLNAWGHAVFRHGDHVAAFAGVIRERFQVRHCYLTTTGRAALTVLLGAFRRLGDPARDEVIIPSYTCFSVPAAVVKAGLRPRLVDSLLGTLDFDVNRLRDADFRKVLAVIATNLYGLPNDLPTIVDIARRQGAFVVDDAAQSMGATFGGRFSGTWGDAGLFSFDKGKNVSAIAGGVIVTDADAVAEAIEAELSAVAARVGVASQIGHAVRAAAYSVLLKPSRYWLPRGIPQLKLGTTPYTTEFPLERMPASVASLAATMLKRLDAYNDERRRNAAYLMDRLSRLSGVTFPRPVEGAVPVYLRLPMLVSDRARRRVLLELLMARGIGATGSYPTSVADIPDLAGMPGQASATRGRLIAQRIVTLPTHPYVTRGDLDRICDTAHHVLQVREQADVAPSVPDGAAAGR